MTTWEYCIFTALETSEQTRFILSYQGGKVQEPRSGSRLDVLEELGRQGWELVAVHPLGVGLKEFYFKRPAR